MELILFVGALIMVVNGWVFGKHAYVSGGLVLLFMAIALGVG